METGVQKIFQHWSCTLVLILGFVLMVIMTPKHSVAAHDDSHYRLVHFGDVTLGGLARLHRKNLSKTCGFFYTPGLGRVQAMVYAIEKINNDTNILPNVTLGYDIRDFCQDPVMAARHAYTFAIASSLNCACTRCTSDHRCLCENNASSANCKIVPTSNNSITYPVAAIVGSLTSRAAIPLANFLQAVRIPLIDSSATSEELSSPLYGSFFRTIPPDVNQAKAIADIIDLFSWRFVAAVAVDDSYGRHGVTALERESIKRQTFCLEHAGYIPLSNYSEKLRAIVSFFKQRKTIKVIILWSHSFQGIDLLKEAARQRLRNRVWIFSEALSMVKPEFLPLRSGFSSTGIHLGVQLLRSHDRGIYEYLRARLSRKSSENDHAWWKEFWDAVHADSGCTGGPNVTSPSGCTNVPKSLDVLLDMILDDFAPYVVDAVYATAHALDLIYKCKDPKGLRITNTQDCPQIKPIVRPQDVTRYLRHVNFQGITGKIEVDSHGDPKEAFYDVVFFAVKKINGVESLKKVVIGTWNKKRAPRMNVNASMISWNIGQSKPPESTCTSECKPGEWKTRISRCCWKCLKCADGSITRTFGAGNCTECLETQKSNFQRNTCVDLPIANIHWADLSAIILVLITLFGFALNIFAAIIFIRFRETPIVKASNKVYSFVLLLGIALCFLLAFFYVVQPSSSLCIFLKPTRYLIYTLCCSALFLKTMQMVHAFNVSRLKDWIWVFICCTKRQVFLLLAVLFFEVCLAICWIIFDLPHVHVNIVPKKHVFYTCKPFKHVTGQVLENLMLIYLLSMAGLCTYYAYRARNLPANFNEAKYISFSLYIFLLSWIVYYPIDYALEGWYVAVMSGATILLSSYGLLGCIFAPKLYIMLRQPERNTAEFVRAELRNTTVNRSVNQSSAASGGSAV